MSNRLQSAFRQIGPSLLLRGAIMILLLIAAGVIINRYAFEEILDWFEFSNGAGKSWLNGMTSYFVLGTIFTALGGPRQAVSFFGAYFFGLASGLIIALCATLAGSAIAVAMAILFGGMARHLIMGRVHIAFRMWGLHPFETTLMLRLLPVGSNLLTNVAAGVARIPVVGFILGSALGYLPQTLVFALLGSGVNIGSELQIALSIGLFVLSVVLGVWIYARYRKALHGDAEANTAPL
jgi:uncharacterized membrane protein YdjX (TVP38/TMEM64 family)